MATEKEVPSENEVPIIEHDRLADIDKKTAKEGAPPLPDMTVQSTSADDAYPVSNDTIKLEEHVCIADVADLKKTLQGILDGTKDRLRIDAGDVESLDGAGIQLLVALRKEATSRSIALEWVAVSEQLKNVAKEVGLTNTLQLPIIR